MPHNVRNFWIEAQIDGRKEPLVSGPKAKDGGFTATIKMSDGGRIVEVLKIDGYPSKGRRHENVLLLTVHNLVDKITWFIETRR